MRILRINPSFKYKEELEALANLEYINQTDFSYNTTNESYEKTLKPFYDWLNKLKIINPASTEKLKFKIHHAQGEYGKNKPYFTIGIDEIRMDIIIPKTINSLWLETIAIKGKITLQDSNSILVTNFTYANLIHSISMDTIDNIELIKRVELTGLSLLESFKEEVYRIPGEPLYSQVSVNNKFLRAYIYTLNDILIKHSITVFEQNIVDKNNGELIDDILSLVNKSTSMEEWERNINKVDTLYNNIKDTIYKLNQA